MIRRAVVDDASDIAAVHVASWRRAYVDLMDPSVLEKPDVAARESLWRRVLGEGSGTVLVAVEEGAARGFGHLAASRDADARPATVEVTALYVDPSRWRRGHGRALWTRLVDLAREESRAHVTLWVFEANAAARAFYEAQGCRLDSGRKVHARSGLAEVRYRLAT